MTKILCVCAEGNVRSVAMAYNLKYMGHEAIAVGVNRVSEATMRMLEDWAEVVFVAEEWMRRYFSNQEKVINVGIGSDAWGYDLIKLLIHECNPLVQEALTKYESKTKNPFK